MRGVLPGIGADDFVLLWAGGMWQWLDPLTAIRGVAAASLQRNNIKLLFLGTHDPNPGNRPMPMVEEARALAAELGLLERNVFFQRGWVPFDERQNWLLEADVGVSAHRDTIEARFAFRTRVLDYIWTGLPMILSAGDWFSDWVVQQDVGHSVAPGDVEGWKRAILALADDANRRTQMKARLERIAPLFAWKEVAAPLARYCTNPYNTAGTSGLRRRLTPLLSAFYDLARASRR
jgi:glycosyltransferase involved in cell wall biosynthesis